jgi:phage shock protein PspC (stress-responsive transcriptional regulator)
MRKLYRNTHEGKIAGVCAGLADHFNVDPVLFRIGFVCSTLFIGVGLIPYLLLALIIPSDPRFN